MKKLNNVYEAPKAELVELLAKGEIMMGGNGASVQNQGGTGIPS
jgi:hypothetical protein